MGRGAVAFLLCAALAPAARASLLDQVKSLEKKARARPGAPDAETTAKGLKEALSVGTRNAVKFVSKTDGYFKEPEIRIPLPEKIAKTAQRMRKLGLGKEVDEFERSMNRAAEQAAPQAEKIFVDAVKAMTISDALKILHGADTAATQYFKGKTSEKIAGAFRPPVSAAMDSVGVTRAYKRLADKARKLRLLQDAALDLDGYVTGKAVDGLFIMVGREETRIRKDPAARVTELLRKVFK